VLPVWQKAVEPYIKSGDLIAIGVVQEQHPDRTRLYRQWRQLKWPIFVDSLNTLEQVKAVPIPVAIDESGVVVDANFRPEELDAFMKRSANIVELPRSFNRASPPSMELILSSLANNPTAEIFQAMGEAYFRGGDERDLDNCVYAFEETVRMGSDDARAHFRLGTALRRRYETRFRKPGDAQAAVDHWGRALDMDPNHYIYRRRLQQYGPRLDKPYNFYFWVEEARKAIRERGEEPVALTAEPMGSEISAPENDATRTTDGQRKNPDPENRINHDKRALVNIESLVTPSRVQPGHRVRGRVTFRLNEKTKPYWNNEADDLAIWLDLPEGVTLIEGSLDFENPETPETQELRQLEFEVQLDDSFEAGAHQIPSYALYYVCDDQGGVCYYLRQDFTLAFTVDGTAAPLK
jgi:hypothetical protein